MAVSICPRCQNGSFEIREAKVRGIHQLLFVQCADCGAAVGVVESHASMFRREQEVQIGNLERQVESIASAVGHIGRIVGALANQSSY